jgi:hypothetical protein
MTRWKSRYETASCSYCYGDCSGDYVLLKEGEYVPYSNEEYDDCVICKECMKKAFDKILKDD